MKNRTISFLTVSLLAIMFVTIHVNRAAASFNQDFIMSDPVFDNTSIMSSSDIDVFLNKFPQSCISTNHGLPWPEPTGYSRSSGFTYSVSPQVTAGTVIYDAAKVYGINPEVLISTLQKESSVVTGTASYGCQYINTSMGYGCPDSGSCPVNPATQSGFSKQVIHAAWLLRFGEQRSEGNINWNVQLINFPHNGNIWDNSDDPQTCYTGPMTAGYRKQCPNGSSTYYDGSYTIDGTGITVSSGATATFYYYTPHFSGNQHLVSLFEDTFGFGSTTTGMLSIAHPDGSLVRVSGSPAVYQIVNGQARLVPSLGVFQSWGFNFGQVEPATSGDASLISASLADTSHSSTPAPLQYQEGTLLKGNGTAIYAVVNSNGSNTKAVFDSWNTFSGLGYSLSDVLTVADSDLPTQTGQIINNSSAAHPNGTLIKNTNAPTVFQIVNGQRDAISSAAIFTSRHFSWSSVKSANNADNTLPAGQDMNLYAEGTLLKGSGPAIYITDLDQTNTTQSKRVFSYAAFVGLNYNFNNVISVPDSALPTTDGIVVGS